MVMRKRGRARVGCILVCATSLIGSGILISSANALSPYRQGNGDGSAGRGGGAPPRGTQSSPSPSPAHSQPTPQARAATAPPTTSPAPAPIAAKLNLHLSADLDPIVVGDVTELIARMRLGRD